jgi:glutamate-1-semialdehyde aminotransferase
LPDAGYRETLREATRETETLLIIDETHTLCARPGGYTQAHGLEPDLLTVGKAIGSGIASAAYGFSEDVAACTPFHNTALMSPATTEDDVDLHIDVSGETASELIG